MRDYAEYSKKEDSMQQIGKLLDTYNLPRLNYKETENLSIPIMSKEIKSLVFKNSMK